MRCASQLGRLTYLFLMGGGAVVMGILLAGCASAHGAHAAGPFHPHSHASTISLWPSAQVNGRGPTYAGTYLPAARQAIASNQTTSGLKPKPSMRVLGSSWSDARTRPPHRSITVTPASSLSANARASGALHSHLAGRARNRSNIAVADPSPSAEGGAPTNLLPLTASSNIPSGPPATPGSVMVSCATATSSTGPEYPLAFISITTLLPGTQQSGELRTLCSLAGVRVSMSDPPG
jgi:hypothetical protein